MKMTVTFWKRVFDLSIGIFFAQVFAIASVPIISRLYLPNDYGTLGLFNAISGVAYVIAALRYEKAIIIAEEHEVPSLLRLSSIFIIVFSFIFFLLLLLVGEVLAKFAGIQEAVSFEVYLCISVFLNGWLLLFLSLGNRKKTYRLLAIAIALQSIVSNLLKILLGFSFPPQAHYLILSELIGVIFATLFLVFRLGLGSFKELAGTTKYSNPYLVAKRYRKFFRYDVVNSFLTSSSWLLPIIVMSLFFTTAEVGYYVFAYSILRIPINLIGKSAEDVFYRQASGISDQSKLTEVTSAILWSLIRVSFLPLTAILLLGDVFFQMVFGIQWGTAGELAMILSPLAFMWFLSLPVTTLFNTLQKQEKLLSFVISGTILRIAALIIGGMYENLYFAVLLFSISSIIVYFFQFSAIFGLIGYSLKSFFSSGKSGSADLLKACLAGVVFYILPLPDEYTVPIVVCIFFYFEFKLVMREFAEYKNHDPKTESL